MVKKFEVVLGDDVFLTFTPVQRKGGTSRVSGNRLPNWTDLKISINEGNGTLLTEHTISTVDPEQIDSLISVFRKVKKEIKT